MKFSYVLLVFLFFSLIIIVGFVGNVLFIYIVFCWKDMRILCNYFIINNVVVDLCVVLLVVFLRIVEIYYGWLLGKLFCCFFVLI